ncbi:isopenicillin N synthase family dioxygenase [Phenylobacterium sp.]|uniref:isopenicillin N synthase family dioxygenase n=1 Tax=Phenylobacterium sp. TaxID=1871053 RepID=UPI0035B3CF5E
MHRDFQAVPVIDISGLSSADPQARRAAAARIGQAAREVGFLQVTGHGLPEALFDGLLAAAKAVFAEPMERKMAWYIGRSANHTGYVPEGEEVFASGKIDRKEAYDVSLDRPGGEASAPMLGANLWPDLPGFKPAVQAYYAAVAALARRMFAGFALALDLPEDHFEPHLRHPPSQLRLIHYPFDPDAQPDEEGIGAHTDYEFFTILRPTAPGLEVMNGEGRWIDAPPVPGALVINIGDMLEAWTNGEFVATSHRVRKVAEERYSFPFFATCDYETVVAPHPRFVGAERPARYPSIVSGEHLFAQTARTFAYLKARRARGELVVADEAPAFGQAARQPARP